MTVKTRKIVIFPDIVTDKRGRFVYLSTYNRNKSWFLYFTTSNQ